MTTDAPGSHTLIVRRHVSRPETDTLVFVRTTVAERLDYSPPTKAIRAQSPEGSLPIFASGNRAGQCLWLAGFLGDLPLPPPLHYGAAPFSRHSALIGSQSSLYYCQHWKQDSIEKPRNKSTVTCPERALRPRILSIDFVRRKSTRRVKMQYMAITRDQGAVDARGTVAVARQPRASKPAKPQDYRLFTMFGWLSNNEANEAEMRREWSSARMKGEEGTGDAQENLLISGVFQHDSHLQKSSSDLMCRPSISQCLWKDRRWLSGYPAGLPTKANRVQSPAESLDLAYRIPVGRCRWSAVTFTIGSQFIRPALHASEPITSLQVNTSRIPEPPGVGQQPMNTQLSLQYAED
ncbi:hypothetical protein PR048_003583 [Dryococelus australis]|uniref:Uncharacterized protein n=1 Tax=Dryococelus australis TaxID=614101 RepID=A0ABQ9IQC6_9NEOP|nr:hypothetical protein PR048_003583 [Dryococelus australis]